MNPLDPMTREGQVAVAGKQAQDAAWIAKELKKRYLGVVDQVQKQFRGELQDDPFQAMFAMAEEARDRLVRTKGVEDQWELFLHLHRGEIWVVGQECVDELTS